MSLCVFYHQMSPQALHLPLLGLVYERVLDVRPLTVPFEAILVTEE
jgi:hypothetical protein